MARSHVCLGCGTELARVRAAPDPCYGLPVVVCSSCARPSVRRPHAGMRGARGLRALLRTLCQSLWRSAAVVLTIVVASLCIVSFADSLNRYDIGPAELATGLRTLDDTSVGAARAWFDSTGLYIVAAVVLASVFTGAVLVAWLDHWRPGALLLAWTGAILAILFVAPYLIAVLEWAGGRRPLAAWIKEYTPERSEAALRASGAAGALAVAALASPLGVSMRRAAEGRAIRRYRRRRARLLRIRRAST